MSLSMPSYAAAVNYSGSGSSIMVNSSATLTSKLGAVHLSSTPKPFPPGTPNVTINVHRGITEIEALLSVVEGKGYICGGYARYCTSMVDKPVPADDVDVFCIDTAGFFKLKDDFAALGLIIYHESDMSIIYHDFQAKDWFACPKVNLIKPIKEDNMLTYGTIEDIIGNFDFTICRVGLVDRKTAIADPNFSQDEKAKQINIANPHNPIASVLRIGKYMKRGYTIHPKEIFKLFDYWHNHPEIQEELDKIQETGNKPDFYAYLRNC